MEHVTIISNLNKFVEQADSWIFDPYYAHDPKCLWKINYAVYTEEAMSPWIEKDKDLMGPKLKYLLYEIFEFEA
jgi:hypothetical protein